MEQGKEGRKVVSSVEFSSGELKGDEIYDKECHTPSSKKKKEQQGGDR